MKVFARYELAADEFTRCGPFGDARRVPEPALLLEGTWPQASTSRQLHSLDDAIDSRFAWIDEEASRLAELAGASRLPPPGGCWSVEEPEQSFTPAPPSPAHLNALALRYYLVKLLRLIAFVQEVSPNLAYSQCDLFATQGRDEDYADLLTELGRAGGFEVVVHWCPAAAGTGKVAHLPQRVSNSWPRRRIGQLACWLDKPGSSNNDARPRVVLSGNPRVLDPVCDEFVRRSTDIWWLCDRFAVGCWRQWRPRGVRQLICNADRAAPGDPVIEPSGSPRLRELRVRGIRVDGIVQRWLNQRILQSHERETRFFHRTLEHLRRVAPRAILLDEDATPLARAAIAAARVLSIPSWIVQHGVPGIRFGFTPLTADYFCAADEPSRQQLRTWNAPADRVVVTGSPALDALRVRFNGQAPSQSRLSRLPHQAPTILLLATTPPRDDRPDAVEFHLTSKNYAKLLNAVGSAVAKFPGAKLIVKPHPRDPHPAFLLESFGRQANTVVEMATQRSLERLLPEVDVVLSCGSTGGIEAAALGWPVIQLLPEGSGDLLRAEAWGLLGTARDARELESLLPLALERGVGSADRSVGENMAASRIVDLVLSGITRPAAWDSEMAIPEPLLPVTAG